MLNKLKNKLVQMIKIAYVSLVSDDSSTYPRVQVAYNGKASDAVRLSVYGVCSNPPEGSLSVLLSSQGQESVKFAISDDMANRLKSLKEGECALYNTKTGVYVKLNEDNEVEIVGDTVKITGATEITGNVDITGDLTVTGTIEGNVVKDAAVTLGTHVHTGVTVGSGSTGGPV